MSFKELSTGQHVFEWKTSLKGVKVAILIKKNQSLWSEKFKSTLILEQNFTSQKCCPPFNSFTRFFHSFHSFYI